MASVKISGSVNKPFLEDRDGHLDEDESGINEKKLGKRKFSDMLGPQWREEELEHFYEAYHKYGKKWKEIASVIHDRSVEMVQALYNMNKAYLSLPEGAASVAGFIAMMMDHYDILDSKLEVHHDAHQESGQTNREMSPRSQSQSQPEAQSIEEQAINHSSSQGMESSGTETVAGTSSGHDSPVGTLKEEQCALSTASTHSQEAIPSNLTLAIVEVDNFEVVASDSAYEEEDIETVVGDSVPNKRRTRGVTRLTTVMPPKGQKWTCLVDKNNKPIGDYGSKLSQALGVFARMEPYFPVHNEWNRECEVSFSMIFQKIISAYDFVDKNGNHVDAAWVRHYCRETVKDRVKEFRAWLKKRYWTRRIVKNEEVPSESPDNRVSQECWDALKEDWNKETKINEASRNKKNRAHGRVVHSRGSTSIATFMHTLEQEMGENYDNMEAYCTYFKKNGAYGNNYIEEKCEEARVVYGELSQSSLGSVSLPHVLDSVYGGHHGGYERGIGVGAPRRRPRHGDIHVHCQQTIQSVQGQLESAQSQLENTQSQLENTQNELRDTRSKLQNTVTALSQAQAQIEVLQRTLDRFERFMNKQQHGHGKGRKS